MWTKIAFLILGAAGATVVTIRIVQPVPSPCDVAAVERFFAPGVEPVSDHKTVPLKVGHVGK